MSSTERNLLVRLFVIIPCIVLVWTTCIFTVIYLAGGEITYGEVVLRPGDPGYLEGYLEVFFWLAGSALVWAVVIGSALSAARPVRHRLAVDIALNPYLYTVTKRHETLTTSAFVFDYDRRKHEVRTSRDPEERDKNFALAFFWLDPDSSGVWTIRELPHGLKVKISSPGRWTTLLRTYQVAFDPAGSPASCVEAVSAVGGGNSSLRRWVMHRFTDVNRQVRIDIVPAIRAAMVENDVIL